MKRREDPRWQAIVRLALEQHGTVARRQLLAAGFTSAEVLGLVGDGVLHPVHRGVYHLGHPRPSRTGRHAAAALMLGPRTGVSHRPAVILRGLLPDRGDPIELTTASGGSGWHDGIRVHESRRLTSRDLVRAQGVPAVTLEWAMVDVAGSDPEEFGVLFRAMDRRRALVPGRIAAQLRRGRAGSALVRAHMATWCGEPPAESELEDVFLGITRGAGLPDPVRQASPLPQRVQRVDFTWPGPRVAVEIDSRVWHAIQDTWGDDHERDAALRLAGWTSLRYTHRQLTTQRDLVIADLTLALRGRNRPALDGDRR